MGQILTTSQLHPGLGSLSRTRHNTLLRLAGSQAPAEMLAPRLRSSDYVIGAVCNILLRITVQVETMRSYPGTSAVVRGDKHTYTISSIEEMSS